MSVRNWIRALLAIAVVAAVPLTYAGAQSKRTTRTTPSAPGQILLTWGVGGVLTGDGTLWQYRPEARRWVTIDQSFTLDGEKRSVLPLPVAASQISEMEGFGFLVTRQGVAWLYDLDANQWKNIGKPGG